MKDIHYSRPQLPGMGERRFGHRRRGREEGLGSRDTTEIGDNRPPVYELDADQQMILDQSDRFARKELYPTQIVVTALNEPGALGIISTTIGEIGGNIDNISFVPHAADFREMLIDLEVWDIKHLNAILSQLRGKSVVSKVERLSG